MTRTPKAYRARAEDLVPMAWTSPWTPTEAELTALFLGIADAKGWRPELRYHTHDSRRSTNGYPDWTMVHPRQGRVMFVELKGYGGKPTEEQRVWLGALNAAGAEAYLLTTTGDYARDAASIAELLSARPSRRSAA